MKRIVYLKWLVGLALMCSILTAMVLVLIPRKEFYSYLYTRQNMEQLSGMTIFEADLNYDGLVQQIMGNAEIRGLSTYESSPDLDAKLERLHSMYVCCEWICGLGLLLIVAGIMILRTQRWYECLKLGGLLTVGMQILLAGVVAGLPALHHFVINSQYQEFLAYDEKLVEILPTNLALCMAGSWAVGCLLIAGIVLLIYLVNHRKYRPHRF